MPFRALLPVFLMMVLANPTAAHSLDEDRALLKASVNGPRTTVMVLGTPHLRQIPSSVSPAMLSPLLDKISSFQPNVIATEVLTGEDCQNAQAFKIKYDGVLESYCTRQNSIISLASKTTGLSIADAQVEASRMISKLPAKPAPEERRRLAAVFGSAGDYGSALVQWLRMPASDRISDRNVSTELKAMLEALAVEQNEVSLIAAPLAVQLKLERLYPSDDHSADSILNSAAGGLTPVIQGLWQIQDAYSAEYRKRISALKSSDDLLSLYRFLNSEDGQRGVLNGEWRSALKEESPERYGRQYVAWWETRNLRMAANIRANAGNHPGARVLMIVGASHKPYLDDYLSTMHDIDTTDTNLYLP